MLQESVESFTVQQKVLMHSKKLYCASKSYTMQQKVLLYRRKLYCVAESFTALQKVLLRSRRFYCIAEKSAMCWRKVHPTTKAEDKLTLQCLPLDFGLNVCVQTDSDKMVLWSPFREALGPTSFLEKA